MYRKLAAFLLAVSMIMALAGSASAASYWEEKNLKDTIEFQYQKALKDSDHESLGGFCGLLASWQLYYMGINARRFSADGRDYYNIYEKMDFTSGGYPVKTYSAKDYTLRQALNAVSGCGTRDVYNMLVGFQWTNTKAGARCGHAVVVYAIIDGMVYFTESFDTSLGTKEGKRIKITMDQFADYYADWMEFEGIVVFGNDRSLNAYTHYPTSIFVEANCFTQLMTRPVGGIEFRSVQPGERLWATGLYESAQGELFYQIAEGDRYTYVAADTVDYYMSNPQDLTYLPGENSPLSGMVTANAGGMRGLRVSVSGNGGGDYYSHTLHETTQVYNLDQPRIQALLQGCPGGDDRTMTVSVELQNYCVEEGGLTCRNQWYDLNGQGMCRAILSEPPAAGWLYEQGKWYFYWDHEPQTGWILYRGVHYYLDAMGAAMTGEQVIGDTRYTFSPTGAMLSQRKY